MVTLSLDTLNSSRRDLLRIMEAALAAVDPRTAVHRALQRDGAQLRAGGRAYDLDRFDRVWVLGAGKAGAPMAAAAEEILGSRLTGGVVVVKYGHGAPVEQVQIREAAHPVPDRAGLEAGQAILELALAAGPDDLVLCLISGGGSALLEALAPPLTLEDLRETTELLLAGGVKIEEMNTLRKHLSQVKGGQLARAAAPATILSLVLSDVVGSPLDVIASGPTVPDPSTWADVAEIVDRYDLHERLPPAVAQQIEAGVAGERSETPKPDDPVFERSQVLLVGDNALAASAAEQAATAAGYGSLILTTFLEGEAREVAQVVVALGREVQRHGRPVARPACLILGGETTVTLRGSPGQGGRNQELALAAALALSGRQGITVGALATDGTDGPTDSAGAVVDGGTVARATAAGMDAAAHLAAHDAYPLLAATGDLLVSGPTRTNVNDLLFALVP